MPTFGSIFENFEEVLKDHSKEVQAKRAAIRAELAEKFGIEIDGELARGIARFLVPFHTTE